MTATATYCPEDNKLRLYPDWDDPDFDKEVVKAVGFRWASKQECYVCPRWTPQAEDVLLDLVDEIEDEDYSPEERSADRAERFSGYREKRRSEAGGYADTFEAGPSAFGHQNLARAERQARRHDRLRGHAVSRWSKAEYWQQRTAGVIGHALYKSSPEVRRSRLVRLESSYRGHLKSLEKSQARYDAWKEIATMEGADILLPLNESGYAIPGEMNEAQRKAYTLANSDHCMFRAYHPTSEEANAKNKEVHGNYFGGFSAYDFLTDNDYIGTPFERMTPKQFAELYLSKVTDPSTPGTYSGRWTKHYELRIGYERAMLEAEGGIASDDSIEPGYVTKTGKYQVIKVNKSQADGRVVSVNVVDATTWKEGRRINIERMGSGQFFPPTDEQLKAFQAWGNEQKAKTKARNAQKAKLINPTPEDAAKLQELVFNAEYKDEAKHAEPISSTQAAYTSQTGNYGKCKTIEIGEKMQPMVGSWRVNKDSQRKGVIKVRIYRNGWNADRVVVITDKPQKPIRWELFDEIRAGMPTEESHGRAFAELWSKRDRWGYEFNGLPEDERANAKQLRQDAAYLGWARCECSNQFDLTEEGRAVLEKWRDIVRQENEAPVGQLF